MKTAGRSSWLGIHMYLVLEPHSCPLRMGVRFSSMKFPRLMEGEQ